MAALVRPSGRVAAARRRAFIWTPLLAVAVLVVVAAGPMITVFNSLDVAGIVLLAVAVLGFISEVGR